MIKYPPSFIGIQLAALFLLTTGCGDGVKKTDRSEPEAAKSPDEVGISPADPQEPFMVKGKEVYEQYCLVCHQVNGGGVSGLNPPLRDTEFVLGDKTRLLRIILKGSNEGLLIKGVQYSNAMPGFSYLSDEEIAFVASYIRNSFGNVAETVAIEEVIKVREGE